MPTSREPGLLLPLVTEDAVRDFKGRYPLQGVQKVLGGPAWKSQVVDPLHVKNNISDTNVAAEGDTTSKHCLFGTCAVMGKIPDR